MKLVLSQLEVHAVQSQRNLSATFSWLAAATVLFSCISARAIIVGTYSASDTNTLHLWHLDESGVPAIDAAVGGTNMTVLANGATLGGASFTGFGSALDTGVGTTAAVLAPAAYVANSAADDIQITYADTNTGAFTVEAILRIDFDPATVTTASVGGQPMYIVTCENDSTPAGSQRPWQWAVLAPAAAGGNIQLRFFAGGSAAPNNFTVNLPRTGPEAIVQGNWYHVAVTFPGGAVNGVAKQYSTSMDPSRAAATQVGANFTLNILVPKATASPAFEIGNVGRGASKGRWIGRIDEVRISKVERSATQMMFAPDPSVSIITNPVGQTNVVGQPATFNVVAGGIAPTYQWRSNAVPINGATQAVYNIPSVQLSYTADYDVVVTNSVNAVTSTVAHLEVRAAALNLTWIGSANSDWEIAALNWDSGADNVADTNYTGGDNVLFNNAGASVSVVNLIGPLNPSSVTVNADNDYLLTTAGGGAIVGNTGLAKQGIGRVVLDTDNTYTGPTTITGGILQVGVGATRGLLGTGPVTNMATLTFNRTDTITVGSSIAGDGELKKDNTGSVLLLGTNTLSGKITLNGGNVTAGVSALGTTTNIVMNGAGAGNGTSLTLRGVTIGSDVTLSCLTGPFDNRTAVITESGTNILNCAIVVDGGSSASFNNTGGRLEINGPVTGPSYTDFFTLRGAGTNCILRGTVTLPNGMLQKTDATGTWVVSSTNSSYLFTRMLGGPLILGNNDALATNGYLLSGGGVLDLAGFNQTFDGLADFTSGTTIITNSSVSTDSRLSIVTAATRSFNGIIAGPGVRKLSVTLAGGSQTFSNANTYSGDTTITSGTFALAGNGSIPNTTPIMVSGGATLDVTARNNGTLTLTASQVLKGNGTVAGNLIALGTVSPGDSIGVLNVTSNATLSGTTFMEVDIAGGTNDQLNVTGTLTYGGTLAVTNIGGGSYSVANTFKLFNAASYGGAFSGFTPSVPAFGLKWNTSTLTTDGILRIATIPTYPTNITATVVGGNMLQLDWPADHTGWTLQMQTNSINVGISTNWVNVPGSASTNQVVVPIAPATGCAFFRMVYP